MLLNEIGRFGDSIEDLHPSDLADEVPSGLRKGCVGMFWHVGNNKWIIRTAPVLDDTKNAVEMGQNFDEGTNPEDLQIDSYFFHKDVWNSEILPEKPEWKDFGFDHFSRGRVIFEVLKHKFVIYIPKSPDFPQEAVLFLARMFQLPFGSFDTNNEIYKKKKDLESLGSGKNEVLPL
jgi:hypothetical protein